MMVLPFGIGDAEVRLGEGAADAEDQVGFLQEVMHGRRAGEAAGAERERVRFRKCAFAAKAGGDGNGEQFGEPLQLGQACAQCTPWPA